MPRRRPSDVDRFAGPSSRWLVSNSEAERMQATREGSAEVYLTYSAQATDRVTPQPPAASPIGQGGLRPLRPQRRFAPRYTDDSRVTLTGKRHRASGMRPTIKAGEARREGGPRRRWCNGWISVESHPFSAAGETCGSKRSGRGASPAARPCRRPCEYGGRWSRATCRAPWRPPRRCHRPASARAR